MNDRNEINYPLTVHWIEDILLVHWGNICFSLNRKAALMMAKALTDAIAVEDFRLASLAGLGQTSAQQLGTLGSSAASGVSGKDGQ
jgi:hypothetical protein